MWLRTQLKKTAHLTKPIKYQWLSVFRSGTPPSSLRDAILSHPGSYTRRRAPLLLFLLRLAQATTLNSARWAIGWGLIYRAYGSEFPRAHQIAQSDMR